MIRINIEVEWDGTDYYCMDELADDIRRIARYGQNDCLIDGSYSNYSFQDLEGKYTIKVTKDE